MLDTNVVVPATLVRGRQFNLRQLIDYRMAGYAGRDGTLAARLEVFASHLGDKVAEEITTDDVCNVLDAIREKGKRHNIGGRHSGTQGVATNQPLSGATLNRYLAAIQGTLTMAHKKRFFDKSWVNPCSFIEKEPESEGRLRYLSPDEYHALLAKARYSRWKKLSALIMLAVTTGLRKGAMMGLKWGDINLDEGYGIIERTKNGQAHTFLLTDELRDELTFLRGAAPDNELVFCGKRGDKPHNFTHAWKSALKEAGIEDVVLHSCRHTHASWLAQNGAQLHEIAESMRHKSLRMTMRYSHLCMAHRKKLHANVFGGSHG